MNFAVHFIRVRSNLILSCSSRPFLLYYAACGVVGGGGEEKKRIVSGREGGGNWNIFSSQENGFPYFIYVVAIISI